MGTPLKSYDLKNVILIVGAVEVHGYAEDGGVSFEWSADIGEIVVGADGEAVFARNNDRHMRATISLLETSEAYRLLGLEMQAQGALLSLVTLPFVMQCPSTGDSVTSGYVAFTKRPALSKSKGPSVREFELFLANPVVTYGALNLS
jgi:hypothetical protein